MIKQRTAKRNERGVTLVELVVAMVIISIAVSGVMMVMNYTVSHSADPVIQHQALAIAEAYLEEIQLQSYADPDGTNSGESRATFDNVDDYSGLVDSGAHDQNGGAIGGLEGYAVRVTVTDDVLGPGDAQVPAKKIEVQVQQLPVVDLSLVGYRANY
ncbi:MAG: prepilin-type N-terminal cleavage/methylation domain-containing protein [Desulfuromonas sp.]|nr:prepilin-type N-terminal cleavage/methylation domain-containing protein [Desulfuromonas sp.]